MAAHQRTCPKELIRLFGADADRERSAHPKRTSEQMGRPAV
ncbi:hypothetical protein ABZ079_27515 [Streptomyces sp. NPDC006314]